MNPYEDMLHLNRPRSRHPVMERAQRAKQFMPFAALVGYGDELESKRQIFFPRPILGDDDLERMDRNLEAVRDALRRGEKPTVALSYFLPVGRLDDNGVPLGLVREIRGAADKISDGRVRVNSAYYPLTDLTDLHPVEGDA